MLFKGEPPAVIPRGFLGVFAIFTQKPLEGWYTHGMSMFVWVRSMGNIDMHSQSIYYARLTSAFFATDIKVVIALSEYRE